MMLPAVTMLSAAVHGASPAEAGDAASGKAAAPVDKWQYNLFNPVPHASMREMSTDRPDQTESPYTVDAGHFQVEMDIAKGTFDIDRSNGGKVRSRTINFGSVNLKAGLLNNVDIQFVIDPYGNSRVEDRIARTVEKASGFGDVESRLKINLWGNDGGRTALAIMPFVKWPLPESGLRNGKTEGGVIIPLAIELPYGWSTALMTEFDFVRNDENGYDAEFVNSITFSHNIAGKLGGYFEFFSVTGSAPGFDWQGQLDVGFTYAVNDNAVLDLGCNFGVTKAAPDFNPFVGFSIRF
ncbi:MAG: hypothetical protein JWL59_2279 [Chthoniobacteraceae bacterium]|nr:hypothetical protein [Chthoniobacteraceae bacterium]